MEALEGAFNEENAIEGAFSRQLREGSLTALASIPSYLPYSPSLLVSVTLVAGISVLTRAPTVVTLKHIVHYSTVQYSTVQYSTVQYSPV